MKRSNDPHLRPPTTAPDSPGGLASPSGEHGSGAAKITWDIYQHVTPTMQADAAEAVARLIFGSDA